jgi:hypothetical protein
MRIRANRRTNRLASCFSERLWRPALYRCGDRGQHRGRRHSQPGDDRSSASLKSEILEVHLRQHEDQREQEQFEDKQDPTPPLHEPPSSHTELSRTKHPLSRVQISGGSNSPQKAAALVLSLGGKRLHDHCRHQLESTLKNVAFHDMCGSVPHWAPPKATSPQSMLT